MLALYNGESRAESGVCYWAFNPGLPTTATLLHRYLSCSYPIGLLNPAVYISYWVKWKNIDWEAGGRIEWLQAKG